MIRYGILSAARIVPRFVQGIRESDEGEVYAIASRTKERAEQAAAQLGIPHWYGSYEELLADENVDVVYIPTTNDTHYRWAKAALEQHKNVILEKPFTLHYEEAADLFQTAERNGCFLMEDQKELFLPVTEEIMRLIHAGEIGDIQFIEMSMSHPNSHPKGNWMYDLASGGGALYGSGSYPIEYAFHLLGSTSFEADGALVKGEGTADNLVHFYMSRENVIVSTTISMDVVLPNIAVIRGSKGRIEVENFWKADHFDIIIGDERTSFRFPYVSEFKYTVDHVNSCLKEGRLTSPVVTPAVTAECVRLMEQINRKAIV